MDITQAKEMLKKKIILQEAMNNEMSNEKTIEETPLEESQDIIEVSQPPMTPDEIRAEIDMHKNAIAQLEQQLSIK